VDQVLNRWRYRIFLVRDRYEEAARVENRLRRFADAKRTDALASLEHKRGRAWFTWYNCVDPHSDSEVLSISQRYFVPVCRIWIHVVLKPEPKPIHDALHGQFGGPWDARANGYRPVFRSVRPALLHSACDDTPIAPDDRQSRTGAGECTSDKMKRGRLSIQTSSLSLKGHLSPVSSLNSVSLPAMYSKYRHRYRRSAPRSEFGFGCVRDR